MLPVTCDFTEKMHYGYRMKNVRFKEKWATHDEGERVAELQIHVDTLELKFLNDTGVVYDVEPFTIQLIPR